MHKIYVLDTNVLLHDPQAIFKFEDNSVVIPIQVIEEIDHFKREMSERGRNARQIARYVDELRLQSAQNGANLQSGVALENGGRLRVAVLAEPLPLHELDGAAMDRAIVRTALDVRDKYPDTPTIFVTMDSNLRIRADALGLYTENYEGARISIDNGDHGVIEVQAAASVIDKLGRRETVPITDFENTENWLPNIGIVLTDVGQPSHAVLARYDAQEKLVRPLLGTKDGVSGIKARNLEQRFALDLLLDERIHLVTLLGKAGTGKTLMAVAAGLKKVLDEGVYGRLVVSRPIFPLGRDVGYLPGSLEEKLNPWMKPIFDNLEFIFSTGRGRGMSSRSYEELLAAGTIEVEPLTYIRGRSLPNQFLIVDEAQNLTPHEVKTIITRAGTDTKIVLTGDPEQIDNPYVDAASNGLAMVAERFKNETLAGHVRLLKGERSLLAERATQLL